ncbi:MAG: glycosyltransferase family 2 protein [Deltaproteobacteria bacterium]|jgi:glycosyltransferase involved in cell wall biosynthesis|nr:glycosyltransferase family 2 protein [Deltaproteobacteria bacterium]
MSPAKIDVIILARDEEASLPGALQSALPLGPYLGELLVIDDHSQDHSAQLAQAVGARVIPRKLDNFAAQRDFALTQAQSEWVFFLDADERMSSELIVSLKNVLDSGQPVAGSVKRQVFAFGRRRRFGPLTADRVTRLFPRTQVRWEGLVHERPICPATPLALGGHLEHHTYADWAEYLAKWRQYSLLWAEQARIAGQTATPLKAITRAGLAFLKMFLGRLGILGGPEIWALCWYHSGYTLSKYLLLSEARPTVENPEANPSPPYPIAPAGALAGPLAKPSRPQDLA